MTGTEPPVAGGPALDIARRIEFLSTPAPRREGVTSMKRLFGRLLVVVLALGALVAAGCGGGSSGDKSSSGGSSQSVNLTEGSNLTIAMVTHSDEGSFWSVVKKGAQQAAKDEGVKLIWSPSNNDPQKEAQLISAAVSQKVDGLAVSVPNADAIKGALAQAKSAGIPIVTLNSGADESKALGAITHVGQDEAIAGKAAGARFKSEGVKTAIKGASSSAKLATFDLNPAVIKDIKAGNIEFAVDQQQYLQGYLPIVFLKLFKTNANTVGGGLPVLTGPGFVDKGNASTVSKLAEAGTR